MSKLRFMFVVSLVSILICGSIGLSMAQEKPKDYPTRPIELVVGYGPGGGSDVFTRTLCIPARRSIREVPLVVVNKPGGGGAVAVKYVQDQPADGYTLFAGSTVICATGNLGGLTEATYTDWRSIMRAQYDITMLVTKGDGKYQDIKALMDDAKARPGEVTLGVVGSAQFWEVVIGQFAEPLGLEFKYVPFNSAGKLYASVLGGHIDLMAEEPGTMAELIAAGKLRALLVFNKERVKAFPDVPTTAEFGSDATMAVFRGIAVKKGTPEPIVQYLHSVFKNAMENKFYANYANFEYLDLRPGYLGPDDSDQFLKDYYNTIYKIYKRKGWLTDKVKIRPE